MEELNNATITILKSCFELYSYKINHSHSEYRAHLESMGWVKHSPEERRAIRVGTALYENFSHCPQALANIEPKVIYSLVQGRYTKVIKALTEYQIGDITQELVIELMRDARRQSRHSCQKIPNIIDKRSQAYLQEIAEITQLSIEEIIKNAIYNYHSQVLVEREIEQTKEIIFSV